MKRLAASVLVLLALAGCESVRSHDVRSGGIRASILVRVTGQGASVNVTLTAGGLTSIDLDPGDSLTASGGGRIINLRGTHFAGASAYSGTLTGVTKPGTKITVALHRGASDTDAPHSTVELPGPITARVAARTYSRSRDAIALHLNGNVGDVHVDWHGSCAVQDSIGVVVAGPPYVIASGTLQSVAPGGAGATSKCDLSLVVTRVEHGDIDPALNGGGITAERQATVVIRSVP